MNIELQRRTRKMLRIVAAMGAASSLLTILAGCNGSSPTVESGKNDSAEIKSKRADKKGEP